MVIYHGTFYKHLASILEQGICPRKSKGRKRKSNWKNAPSHQDMVYMSKAYPIWYAMKSTDDGELSNGVVFEIDTDLLNESHFYPDEDFVFEVMKNKIENLKPKHIRDNLEFYQYLWQKSLECFGGFCHKGTIPVSAITRYCIIDFLKRDGLYVSIDPCISIMNYQLLGQRYERTVQWLFNDRELLPFAEMDDMQNRILDSDCDEIGDVYKKLYDDSKKRLEYWKNQSKDRTGIELFQMTHTNNLKENK